LLSARTASKHIFVAVHFLGQLAGLNQRSGEMSGGNGIVTNV
jgi:hypothetical protein